jgi:hypothetical protein
MSTTTDRRIDRYLKELDDALKDLPASGRHEIVDEVRGHIDEARARAGTPDEASVDELLERLGAPEDIAAEARRRFGVRPIKPGPLEVIALVMLPIGALVLPFIGWVVGVVCLWVSSRWTTREKVLGTLVLPGGLLLPLGFAFVSMFAAVRTCEVSSSTNGRAITHCSGPGGVLTVLLTAGVVVALALPILVDIYLYRRLRRATG